MTCNQWLFSGFRPFPERFLNLHLPSEAMGWAGWISHTQELKVLPDVSINPLADKPETIIEWICLVSMDKKNFSPRLLMSQNESFVDIDIFKEAFRILSALIIVSQQTLTCPLPVLSLDIVVSPDEMETSFFMEPVHQPVDMAVCLSDILESCIFPELFPISYLNIDKSISVVVIQGVEKKILIVRKLVRPAVIPSVTVTEEDQS